MGLSLSSISPLQATSATHEGEEGRSAVAQVLQIKDLVGYTLSYLPIEECRKYARVSSVFYAASTDLHVSKKTLQLYDPVAFDRCKMVIEDPALWKKLAGSALQLRVIKKESQRVVELREKQGAQLQTQWEWTGWIYKTVIGLYLSSGSDQNED